eukprot:318585_1
MSWARLANRPNNNGSYAPKKRNNQQQTIRTTYDPEPIVQITNSKKKHNDIHTIVLDSGAFIGRQSFFNNFHPTTQYYMTPAVNNEIRDKHSRQFLEQFPYEIHIRKPEPQSMSFVTRFIQKHPNLRSLSKVDRQVIALAHSLELQFEGDKNIKTIEDIINNKKLNPNSSTIKKLNYAQSESGAQQQKVKKSKSGRIHTQLQAMPDTGVRLAVMKKIVPFNFDDFMTMTAQKYGEKYGKPTQIDVIGGPHSPLRLSAKIINNKEINIKKEENKKDDDDNNNDNDDEQDDDKENIKTTSTSSTSPISKAQKRRRRKKNTTTKKQQLQQA